MLITNCSWIACGITIFNFRFTFTPEMIEDRKKMNKIPGINWNFKESMYVQFKDSLSLYLSNNYH